ncbi:putative pyridoxal phosphate-dependent protein CysK2 [Virgisporangium aliadipatigenens]|uniref:Putative pyridoxal phosphate-dependent protein CysK2 n=1 Tax=Virgisporangium aliadipatigenens TaxID=741659 RepID=A0A8J3YP77_9ACTN|nr:PLP-dependent cysteine synthase family protein [Virgisporangium aliadipatigenens]GIJ48032.1 putative pyridoxal phosphate-dependent protein CysK2 [Virgisporangium aliadipatigenens]
MRSTTAARPLPGPAQLLGYPTGVHQSPTDLVGNTPTLWVGAPFNDPDVGFWAKLEGFNPGGIKDRPALHMVARARQRGDLLPGARIVESTSGTLGLGLSLAARNFGHPLTLVTDPGMEPIVHRLLTASGADVDVVTQPHPTGGWQQARRDRVQTVLNGDPTAWCPDQYHNPDNVAAYEGLGLELVAQLGRVDVLVCSVGTGGHSAGIFAPIREYFPHARLVGVDTVGSTIFGQPARSRLMRGLGSSIYPRNVRYDWFSEVHWVGAAESVWACRQLAAHGYVSGGWSVGAVTVVSSWLARTLPPGTRIATVFPDGPQRYWNTVFDDDFCGRHGLLDGDPPTEPDEIDDPVREVRRWTRCTRVIDPTGDNA